MTGGREGGKWQQAAAKGEVASERGKRCRTNVLGADRWVCGDGEPWPD